MYLEHRLAPRIVQNKNSQKEIFDERISCQVIAPFWRLVRYFRRKPTASV